mgnify:CR=1 FL=1
MTRRLPPLVTFAALAALASPVFAGTITASLFGVLMFLVIGFITTRTVRNWHDSASRRP